MSAKVSIVMPVCNVEPYLRECLDSVLAQSMRDFELICVDDGSTDGSAVILGEYAERDPRVSVHPHGPSNAGAARNFGMQFASGDYLMFLDSDDVFSPILLETLCAGAERNGADVAACRFVAFKDGSPVPALPAGGAAACAWRICDDVARFRGNLFWRVGPSPWNKLYRRAFVADRGLTFLEQRSTNDFTFVTLALACSGRTAVADVPLVAYRHRSSSLQGQKSKSPENFIRAVEAVWRQLDSGEKPVSVGCRARMAEFVMRCALRELTSQSSTDAYDRLLSALSVMEGKLDLLRCVRNGGGRASRFCGRYSGLVRATPPGRLSARLEKAFLPLLHRHEGKSKVRRLAAIAVRESLCIMFGWRGFPWNGAW